MSTLPHDPARFDEGSFAWFLAASFQALLEEMPDVYRSICRSMNSGVLKASLDEEPVALTFSPTQVLLSERHVEADVTLRTSSRTVVALIDAKTTLVDAALCDDLELAGELSSVINFYDGLMLYLHGAVRSLEFPRLLALFRATRFKETNE